MMFNFYMEIKTQHDDTKDEMGKHLETGPDLFLNNTISFHMECMNMNQSLVNILYTNFAHRLDFFFIHHYPRHG